MTNNSIWSNQIAIVTGGSGDIGKAIVQSLHELGVRVASADISPFESVKSLEGSPRFDSKIVNVTNEQEVNDWIDEVEHKWGTPTIAIIGAAITIPSSLVKTTTKDWDSVLAVGLDSSFYVSRAVINKMLESKTRGRIVFIGSWAASNPHPHIGSYSVAKAGLRALMQNLALEHASDGILINEVAPGIVEAGLSKVLFERDPALKISALGSIPLGIALSTKDVARDTLFLCSPENTTTTGLVLTSDGGLSITSSMNTGLSK
jgi:glucose 1-dehydrogenase